MTERVRLVIAGATGWIGGAVRAAASSRGIPTVALSARLAASGAPDTATFADLPGLIEDGNTVVINAVGRTVGTSSDLAFANVEVCRLLAQACLRAGAGLLSVGSAAEYGQTTSQRLSETDVEQPTDEYGRSKLAATELVRQMRGDGLRASVARVFNVVGSGRPGVSPITDFAAGVQALSGAGGTVTARDSSLVRDLSSIEWVADRLVDLVGTVGVFDTVNVCSGRATSYRQVIQAMAQVRGLQVRVVDSSPGGIKRVVGDPTRLHSLLPDLPTETLTDLAAAALSSSGSTVAAS